MDPDISFLASDLFFDFRSSVSFLSSLLTPSIP